MNSVSTVENTAPIELWRLIRQEWYFIVDEEVFLSPDCLDLRKDMQPPETCISFNECKGTNYYEKIFQVMEDLFLKMDIKEDDLFARLIDKEICESINKREKLIEFKRDRGEKNSHFGLYYLTDDDTKILAVKSKLINLLEKKLTNIISTDEILKNELKKFKTRKKIIKKEVKRLKIIVLNQIKEPCQVSGITNIEIEINEEGSIILKRNDLDDQNYSKINTYVKKISPITLNKLHDYPHDINLILSGITSIRI